MFDTDLLQKLTVDGYCIFELSIPIHQKRVTIATPQNYIRRIVSNQFPLIENSNLVKRADSVQLNHYSQSRISVLATLSLPDAL